MCRSEGTVWGGCEQKSWTDVKGKRKAVHEHAAVPKLKLQNGDFVTREPGRDPSTRPAPLTTSPALRAAEWCRNPAQLSSCDGRLSPKTRRKSHRDKSLFALTLTLRANSVLPVWRNEKVFGLYLQRGAHYLFYNVHQILFLWNVLLKRREGAVAVKA